MEDKEFTEEEIEYERKQFRREFESSMSSYEEQKENFFKHLDNHICQKCGKKHIGCLGLV